MTAPPSAYSGERLEVTWIGAAVSPDTFTPTLVQVLRERLEDTLQREECIAELQAAAATGMDLDVIERLLTSEPPPLSWEVGEALAECFLQEWHEVTWPWNSGRDRRTPKASLPGADLIGFVRDANGAILLFGEVKTSGDPQAPPQVLYGRHGMVAQLEGLATRADLHWALIKWLRPRCRGTPHWPLYEEAVQRYVRSNGTDIHLVGCLMRDTGPTERDLKSRGLALSEIVSAPSQATLRAWYISTPIDRWPELILGDGSGG